MERGTLMSHSLFDLSGRVALVSGTARGLGRAMAIGFAEAGADLVLADINTEGNEETAAQIEGLGRRALAVTCDVSDPEQIGRMFSRLDREYGRLDVLGNVAGEGCQVSPEALSLEQLQNVLQSLVVGRFYCCQQAGLRMLAAGKGSIINVGSIAGVRALGRGHIAYSIAMGGVVQMTRELSTEWSARGVRVNAILPAQVPNEGHEARMRLDPTLRDTWLRGIAMGRFGVPDDIQGVALFLASDASAWVTGALIPMDGGNQAMNAGASPGRRPEAD
jgi:NAD(P)-dependent dehydrogenase (short-subunit alcohol dehydrogenase family)